MHRLASLNAEMKLWATHGHSATEIERRERAFLMYGSGMAVKWIVECACMNNDSGDAFT